MGCANGCAIVCYFSCLAWLCQILLTLPENGIQFNKFFNLRNLFLFPGVMCVQPDASASLQSSLIIRHSLIL